MVLPSSSPLEDRLDNVVTRHYLESQIAVAWGGRLAEELVFGPEKVTTGASGDLQQIFRVARSMVTQLGMSRLHLLIMTLRVKVMAM